MQSTPNLEQWPVWTPSKDERLALDVARHLVRRQNRDLVHPCVARVVLADVSEALQRASDGEPAGELRSLELVDLGRLTAVEQRACARAARTLAELAWSLDDASPLRDALSRIGIRLANLGPTSGPSVADADGSSLPAST